MSWSDEKNAHRITGVGARSSCFVARDGQTGYKSGAERALCVKETGYGSHVFSIHSVVRQEITAENLFPVASSG